MLKNFLTALIIRRVKKFFIIFGNQEKLMTLNYLRSLLMKYGSLGLNIQEENIGF